MITFRGIREETPDLYRGRRTGRHVEHDDRSWTYPAARSSELVSVLHKRHGAILNQGDLGSCTGNAMAGLLNTDPRPHARRLLREPAAVHLYSLATELDVTTGEYPPDDTGSSGLAVAKAAQSLGLISSYHHAFGLRHALEALTHGPVITGVNWTEGFDRPDSSGYVVLSGNVRGGHEFVVCGLDITTRRVRAANSWGAEWGDHGYFEFSWTTWEQLLAEQGDVTAIAY